MNMKQLKAAAPDLLGSTFSSAAPNYGSIIEQLKAAGMMPAAWALEELMEERTDLQDQLDKRMDPEELEELHGTLDRAVDALNSIGTHMETRCIELFALMNAHEDDADSGLYLELGDIRSSLQAQRDDLTDAVEEVAGVKTRMED